MSSLRIELRPHSFLLAPFTLCGAALILIAPIFSTLGQTSPAKPGPSREVLAFYYPWYGSVAKRSHAVHWGKIDTTKQTIANSAHYPTQGAYDSKDPALIEWHIALAKSNGITGFIVSWWGQKKYEDTAWPVLLECAARQNFKLSPYWEKAPGKGAALGDQAVDDLTYLLTRYGTNDSFLKANGQPVIFVYERVMQDVPAASWPGILSRTRAKAGPFKLIADQYQENYARSFDGVHRYNISWAPVRKDSAQLRSWAATYYAEAVKLARKYNRISCVPVMAGYDDRKVRQPGRNAERRDGEVYRVLWQEAIKAKPDWILINSWNEWHEGSEIEPSVEYGDKYIKLTGEFAPRFTAEKN